MRFHDVKTDFVWIVATPQFAFRTDSDMVVAHPRKAWVPYLYLLVKLTTRQLAENAAEVQDDA